jgi:hypothetical protein
MTRISSTAIFLLITSILVSCFQITTPVPTLEPTQTLTITVAPKSTTTSPPDISSAPTVEPVDGVIEFAGHKWNVKSGCGLGPGPNCWSDSAESVWVQDGELHLKIRKIEDRWYSAEVSTVECSQYGIHRFFVSSDLTSLDKNIVAALFLYKDDQNEIDMEFSTWAKEYPVENAQYVVQPWDIPGNLYRFVIPPNITESIHTINWNHSTIQFESIQGNDQEPSSSDNLLDKWEYSDNHIPAADDCLRVHINLWLIGGNPPSNDQDAVLVVTNAQLPDPYQPAPTPTPPAPIPTTGTGDTASIQVINTDANYVSGLVNPNTYCNDNYRVVIYAKTDIWYVQPFTESPLTTIDPATCSWESQTHPWDKLAIFLVPRNYDPLATLSSQSCPPNLPESEFLASLCFNKP